MASKKWNLLINPYLELKNKGLGCNVIAKELKISNSLAKRLRHFTNSVISDKYLYKTYTQEDKIKIIACILGDGGIFKSKIETQNFYAKISHVERNYDYILYKSNILGEFALPLRRGRKSQERLVNNKTIHCEQDWILGIKSSPYLKELYNILYVNGKKAITKESLKYFTDMTLALLYFDDGSFTKKTKTYRISFGNMEEQYIKIFMNWLLETYNIESTLYSTYGYYSLYIKRKSHVLFENILKKYLVDSMRYKINDEVKQGELLEKPEMKLDEK